MYRQNSFLPLICVHMFYRLQFGRVTSSMSKEKDRAVLCAIGQITIKMDLDDPKHLRYVLDTVVESDDFRQSAYGKRFIDRLQKKLLRIKQEQAVGAATQPTQDATVGLDELIRLSDEKTQGLFRDMDDILFQVASQHTTRTTQRLVWFTVALTVINTIVLFFVAYIVWRLSMG